MNTDLSTSFVFYENSKRANVYITKTTGACTGQNLSFDLENTTILIQMLAYLYARAGTSVENFDRAVNYIQDQLAEMKTLYG